MECDLRWREVRPIHNPDPPEDPWSFKTVTGRVTMISGVGTRGLHSDANQKVVAIASTSPTTTAQKTCCGRLRSISCEASVAKRVA